MGSAYPTVNRSLSNVRDDNAPNAPSGPEASADIVPRANYLFFFSRFACLFSLAVFWGGFFLLRLTSRVFDIRFVSCKFTLQRSITLKIILYYIFRDNAITIFHKGNLLSVMS